jgi:glycosidase
LPIDWRKAETDEGRGRFAFCQNLIAMRRREKALTEGELIWLNNGEPDKVVSFLRKTEDEEILVIINLTNRKVNTWIEFSSATCNTYKNLLSVEAYHEDVRLENKRMIFELNDFAYFIAKS